MFSLADMVLGEQAKVCGFVKGSKPYRSKLLAMGLTPGTPFELSCIAPLGDPVQITLRGFKLSLRKAEARALLLESIE